VNADRTLDCLRLPWSQPITCWHGQLTIVNAAKPTSIRSIKPAPQLASVGDWIAWAMSRALYLKRDTRLYDPFINPPHGPSLKTGFQPWFPSPCWPCPKPSVFRYREGPGGLSTRVDKSAGDPDRHAGRPGGQLRAMPTGDERFAGCRTFDDYLHKAADMTASPEQPKVLMLPAPTVRLSVGETISGAK
jgi:hypothetical protein